MPEPDLKVKISLDQAEAVRGLRSFYATARNVQAQALQESARLRGTADREAARTAGVSAREQIRLNEQQLKSATRVATEEQRLARETARVKTEYIRQEILLRQQADREARKSQQNQRGGFVNALLTSRYSLPGTNGNVMPLIGQTLRGGPGALAALASVGVAAKLSEGFADGVTKAASLERALNILESQSKATAAEMAQVSAKARELGADTKLPATSSVDAANAMLSLSKASLSVEDSMESARGALQLAAAAEMDAAKAGKIMGDSLVAFKLPGTEATRVANLFAASIRETNAEIDDFAVALKYVGPIAQQLEIPIEDVFTALSMLAEAGIRGEMAGTGLRTMLSNLNPTSKEAKKVMTELGISAFDSNGKFIGLKGTIGQFQPVLSTLTDQNRLYALEVLFGKEAMAQANVVLGAGIEKFDRMAEAVGDANAAQEEAEARAKGLKGAMDGLNSALDTFKEKRLTPILGLLEDWVHKGTRILDILDETIDRLAKTGSIPIQPGSVLDWFIRSPRAILETLDENNKTFQKENSAQGKAATAQGDIALFTTAQDIVRNPDKYPQKQKEETLLAVQAAARRMGIPLTGINAPGGYEGIIRHGLVNSQKVVNDYKAAEKSVQDRKDFEAADAELGDLLDFYKGLINNPSNAKNTAIGSLRTGSSRRSSRDRGAQQRNRQLAEALREVTDRRATMTEDRYDALVKQYEKASPAERKRLSAILGIASEFVGEDQLAVAKAEYAGSGGASNPAAIEKLRTAKYKIEQDRLKRAEALAKIEERLVKEADDAAKREADAAKKKADSAADAATDANRAAIESREAREKWERSMVAQANAAGFGDIGSLWGNISPFFAGAVDSQLSKNAPLSLLAAARSGKQTDLAAAFKAFDATRIGGDWGASIRGELSALEQMAGAPGSRLLSREAGPLVQRRLGELRNDALATGDAGLVIQIDEAIVRWKEAMRPASEIFAGRVVDRMSEAGQALFGSAVDSLIQGNGVNLRSFGDTLLSGVRDDIGQEIGERFARSAKDKLSKFFTETQGGFGNLFKGAEQSAMRIALTGYGLLQALQAASQGGGSLLGGILGAGAGFLLGGPSGILTGFSIGANVASGNYMGAASAALGAARFGGAAGNEYAGNSFWGQSRSVGSGKTIQLIRVHNGDNYDRLDREAEEQAFVDDLNSILARI